MKYPVKRADVYPGFEPRISSVQIQSVAAIPMCSVDGLTNLISEDQKGLENIPSLRRKNVIITGVCLTQIDF
jgi:hypothetical protein